MLKRGDYWDFLFLFFPFFSLARYWKTCGVVISALQTPSPSSPWIRLSALQPFAIVFFLLFLSSWPRRLLAAIGLRRRDKELKIKKQKSPKSLNFNLKLVEAAKDHVVMLLAVGSVIARVPRGWQGWQLTKAKSTEIKSERTFSLRVFAFCFAFLIR